MRRLEHHTLPFLASLGARSCAWAGGDRWDWSLHDAAIFLGIGTIVVFIADIKLMKEAWAMPCTKTQDTRAPLLNSQCKFVIVCMGITAGVAGHGVTAITAGDRKLEAARHRAPASSFYLAISFSALSARILITLRAGLALNICSCLVNGLIPMRALVTGF